MHPVNDRLPLLLALLIVGGCQCLEPVDEGHDAAVEVPDAGRDAGVDAGECVRATDCRGTPQVTTWCSTILSSGDAGFSCVDRQCIAQCGDSAGQSCAQDRGVECLRCPLAGSCIPPDCGGGYEFLFTVIELSCRVPVDLQVGDRIRESMNDAGCGLPLWREADAGLLGRIYLQSGRGLSARIDALGGTCLVSEMPTGAPRLLLDCPRCQVALGP